MSNRLFIAITLGVLATVGAYFTAPAVAPQNGTVPPAILLGGLVGTAVGAISAGLQVALLMKKPASNASFLAFGGGFFAKLFVLVVGILLLGQPGSSMNPAAFAVAFLASAILVGAVILSKILQP